MEINDHYIKLRNIELSDEPVEKNRAFLKALSELPNTRIDLFQMLGLGHGILERDPNLTLDIFLSNLSNSAGITLRIGTEVNQDEIDYSASQIFPNEPEVTKYAECSLKRDTETVKALNQIFRDIYSRDDLIER